MRKRKGIQYIILESSVDIDYSFKKLRIIIIYMIILR